MGAKGPETLLRQADCDPLLPRVQNLPLRPGPGLLTSEIHVPNLSAHIVLPPACGQSSKPHRSGSSCDFLSQRRLPATTIPFVKELGGVGSFPKVLTDSPSPSKALSHARWGALVFFHHNFSASDSTWLQVTLLFYFLCFFVFCWPALPQWLKKA